MNPFAFVVLFLQNEKRRWEKMYNAIQKVKKADAMQILTPEYQKKMEQRLQWLHADYDVSIRATIVEDNKCISTAIVKLKRGTNPRDYETKITFIQSDCVAMECSCGFPKVNFHSLTLCLCVFQFVSLLITLSVSIFRFMISHVFIF